MPFAPSPQHVGAGGILPGGNQPVGRFGGGLITSGIILQFPLEIQAFRLRRVSGGLFGEDCKSVVIPVIARQHRGQPAFDPAGGMLPGITFHRLQSLCGPFHVQLKIDPGQKMILILITFRE